MIKRHPLGDYSIKERLIEKKLAISMEKHIHYVLFFMYNTIRTTVQIEAGDITCQKGVTTARKQEMK